jgi:hypothetical protein
LAKKVPIAMKMPSINTYWKPKAFQINPPIRAEDIEKI